MLDTSAVSAFFRGNLAVKERMDTADVLELNPVVLGELLAGFMMGTAERVNRELLDRFVASPRAEIVCIDEETGERYAAIFGSLRRAGTPIPTNDIWIAACAMQRGSVLLTADSHFLKVAQILTELFQT
ncbi:MAG: type II toxin-antitoxin system VapC family toxin [Actinobacteria bacterium]|nr:type II toxin-antitoxin system VapC family toxin [Actinomycetota bacterium]MBU1942950.1 type II toxin-antitoxin system VapC family toxin [Actinomycetota bacterium]MBU2687330.1 type II toxin-antitoxin system VapC family toxin [Actinomycetota bacterium]